MSALQQLIFGAAGFGVSYFTNVALLINGNGTEGSTTFVDESANGTTQTAGGNAKITLLDSDFPSGCLVFDGTGDYVTCPHTTDRDMHPATGTISSTTNWTLEFDLKPDNLSSDQVLLNKGMPASGGDGDPGWRVILLTSGAIRLDVGDSAGAFAFYRTSTFLSAGVKRHICVEVTNGSPSIAFDGVTQSSSFPAGNGALFQASSGNNNSRPVDLGCAQTDSSNLIRSLFFTGKMARIRETTGVSRYGGANLTPPVGLLPTSGGGS